MVKEALVEAAIDAGARLLTELDRTEFPVESMFWAQLPDMGHWRLVIGSRLVRDFGPRVAYERLGALLREIDAGLSLMTISVFEPGSVELLSLLSAVESSGLLVAGPSWLTFGEGVVYRWNADAIVGQSSCEVSADELDQAWKQERKLSNQPKLLFSVQGRRITVRFHPQHARLLGLAKVKQQVRIALHRSRPDCQIEWVDRA
jgi:hypothetical protein